MILKNLLEALIEEINMKKWEIFERNAFEYIRNTYGNGNDVGFEYKGAHDSTAPDIDVTPLTVAPFNVEIKSASAQCGQFVVLDDNGKFVFSIYVKDDAPITITPATVQGKGYKGASYTASKFTVDATGCTVTYKLYYNANSDATADAEGWVEIPSSSSITDTDYNENGYSYSDVQSIAYNGSLTFVPNKIGAYKIVCTASSKTTAREESASTIIKIENEPAVVKPASEWLQNNVWSVVFLSVGTLCLIGIIVLLFIKPKEENDNE